VAFTYEPEKVPTEALHWVRFKVGATKDDASPLVDDAEILGALVMNGLMATSVPSDATKLAIHRAAASVCRSIAASFARQGAVVAPSGSGSPKNVSAETYLKLAAALEAEGTGLVVVGGEVQDPSEPYEIVDSVDYRRDRFGGDHSEYVGDEVT